jgi:predicted nucleic acid-binding protein
MSGPLVVIDTSVFIGAKNPDEPEHDDCGRALNLVHRRRIRGLISTITLAEVLVGYYTEDDSDGRLGFLDYIRTPNRIQVVPVDLEVSEVAARVRSETSLRLPDAIIVASALVQGAQCIVTHDREFEKARHLVTTSSAKAIANQSAHEP